MAFNKKEHLRQNIRAIEIALQQGAATVAEREVRLAALLTTVAAAVAVLCTLYLSDRRENTEIYCYLNGEPVTDIDIALRQVNMAERLLKAGVHSTATGADAIREAGRSLDALRTARNIMEHVKKAAEEVDSQEQPAGPAPRRE